MAASSPPARLAFVDNLRALAIVLVVLIHLAILYGDLGSESILRREPGELVTFVSAWYSFSAQAFVLGLMFWIAGFFTPGAYDRKGPARFLRGRLLRLGGSVLVYDLLVNPVIVYLRSVDGQAAGASLGDFVRGYTGFLTGIGTGPTWFVWNLLLFNVAYAAWRLATRAAAPAAPKATLPGPRAVLAYLLALAAATFFIRLVWPMGWSNWLNLRLPFYAQYVSLFVLGLIAFRRRWLDGLPDVSGGRWLILGGMAILAFPLLAFATPDFERLFGGPNWMALAFAVWESVVCVALSLGLTLFFRRRCNTQGRRARWISANAYAVYVFHVPVIFFVTLALRALTIPPLLLLGLATLVSVPVCFLVAWLIRLFAPARLIFG
jgi:peptidoglycan/LPS O-acetylase OafA/YrhL